MSAICVIPARKGSKRIPGKNTKDFLGRPIIEYVIDTVQESGLFDAIVLSTDDPVAAGIGEKRDITVLPRPDNLCGDHVTTAAVLEHALWYYDVHEEACCVYPTSVFLTVDMLKQGRALLPAQAFAAAPYTVAPQRAFNQHWKMLWPDNRDARTQDLSPLYWDTGLMYWVDVEAFLRTPKLLSGKLEGLIVHNVVDINTDDDWRLAEMMYQMRMEDERSAGSVEG